MIDPRYISAVDLNPYFVDKSTGAPLAGGIVSFWEDDSRATPKPVYELTGAPPNYTFTPLPNPLILSSTGTFVDSLGNNISVYYFPYDSVQPDAAVQLYYITVTNSLGTQQFTRQAWPSNVTQQQPVVQGISNLITNPQFVDVFFSATNTLTIHAAAPGNNAVNLGPGWTLDFTATAATTVTVTRTPIMGTAAYPFNPPYTLTVTSDANVSSIYLFQRFYNNPNIWAPLPAGTNGWISTSVLLGPGSSLAVGYAPSHGVGQGIFIQTNGTAFYQQLNSTVQLNPAVNTDLSTNGYVDININLNPNTTTIFSNVQIVTLETNQTDIAYEQIPVTRQIDQTFNYYNSRLQYKPIASYLIGWDFPSNPAQVSGAVLTPLATGANKSYYTWDQTIIFQSINSSIHISAGGNDEFVMTAAVANTQAAMIQYLDGWTVAEILNSSISCGIESKTSNATGIAATITLWYTTAANLPNVAPGTYNSIVATLDANGRPATFNGSWTEITRNGLGDAKFTVTTSPTTNFNFNGFNGWDLQGSNVTQTATFFAIVVGFGPMNLADTISINSISAVPGDIATRPAYKPPNIVITECSRYYNKSFPVDVIPVTAGGYLNASVFTSTTSGATASVTPTTFFYTEMRAIPNITAYNPHNPDNMINDNTTGTSVGATSAYYASTKNFSLQWSPPIAGVSVNDTMTYHWVADARLGIV